MSVCLGSKGAPLAHQPQLTPLPPPLTPKTPDPATAPPNKKQKQTGDYVFDILMWNKRLLYSHAQEEEEASAGSKLKDKFKGLLSGW